MSTTIPYLDEVWNVTTGCGDDMVSLGCRNCYARRMFGRNLWTEPCPDCDGSGSLGQAHDGREVSCETCGGHEDALGSGKVPQDFTPTFHANRLDQPLHWRKPRRIGVSFMGDLFHEAITRVQIGRVLDTFIMCPQHTFLVLTKRPERMRAVIAEELRVTNMSRFLNDKLPAGLIPNLWPGVTVCNQFEADRNIPILLDTPAAKRWVSLEPLLGAIDMRTGVYQMWADGPTLGTTLEGIDWVVLGGETGPGARRMDPRWATQVFNDCREAGVPFWWKQPGAHLAREDKLGPTGRDWTLWDEMVRTHELPAVTP